MVLVNHFCLVVKEKTETVKLLIIWADNLCVKILVIFISCIQLQVLCGGGQWS